MPSYPIDPFKAARKNAHIWHGENATIWYNEKLDGSFSVLVLYEFGEKKRRLFLEINDQDWLWKINDCKCPRKRALQDG